VVTPNEGRLRARRCRSAWKLGSCERLKVRRRCDCGLFTPNRSAAPNPARCRWLWPSPGRSSGSPGAAVRRKACPRESGGQCHHPRRGSAAIGALPGLRVLPRNKPSTPLSAKRCCHRHTATPATPPTDADALRHLLRRVPICRGKHDAAPAPHVCAASCSRPRSPPTARAPLRSKPRILLCHGRIPQAMASIAYPDACVNRLNVSQQTRLRSGNLIPRTERVEIRRPSNFSRTKPLHRWHSQRAKTDSYPSVNITIL
jgi:hypothetical protein